MDEFSCAGETFVPWNSREATRRRIKSIISRERFNCAAKPVAVGVATVAVAMRSKERIRNV